MRLRVSVVGATIAASAAVTSCALESLAYLDDGAPDASRDAAEVEAATCAFDAAMIDPANCGRCGHDCVGGACSAGVCQPVTIAQNVANPIAITASDLGAFWTEFGSMRVGELAVDGGVYYADAQAAPFAIALQGAQLYWTGYYGASVWTCPAFESCAGAPPIATNEVNPEGIAADDAAVYWVDLGPSDAGYVTDGSVSSCGLSGCGGAPTRLAAGIDYPIANALALDDAYVYVATTDTFEVVRVPKRPLVDGGGGTTLLTGFGVYGLAVYGGSLYFSQHGPASGGGAGGIYVAPLDGGASEGFAVVDYPTALAVDSSGVYWVSDDGRVSMCPLPAGCGGGVVTLATVAPGPYGIALDSRSVFYITRDVDAGLVGTVGRVAKP